MDEPAKPGCVPRWLAHSTWVVVAVVFVGTLGGLHPSDQTRDTILLVAGVIVLAMNLPMALFLVRSGVGTADRGWAAAGLALRLGVAAAAFWFIHGISHDRGDRAAHADEARAEAGDTFAAFDQEVGEASGEATPVDDAPGELPRAAGQREARGERDREPDVEPKQAVERSDAARDQPRQPARQPSAASPEGREAPSTGANEQQSGKLDRRQIREGLEAYRPTVKECYADLLEEFPDAQGRVTIAFDIVAEGGQGRVELAELGEGTDLFDEQLHDCILSNLGDVTFPAPGAEQTIRVNYPFSLRSRAE